jgi:hypothetical protein
MLMSRRLQVIVSDEEARNYERLARRLGMTLSEWVRRTLHGATGRDTMPKAALRLAAIDRALSCGHPTGDVEDMLAEIERGRALR